MTVHGPWTQDKALDPAQVIAETAQVILHRAQVAMNPVRIHHYAGFAFEVVDGRLTAQPGQHAAAYKEKHRMAAQAEFDAHERRADSTSERSNAGSI